MQGRRTPTDEYKYDTDFGNEWLKTNYAGSGPLKIREWRANEVVVAGAQRQLRGAEADWRA
jgi:peptide/nickel transport system substrate-binding protein